MAEEKDDSQEKSQEPTSRRLEKAKEDGKVLSSKEAFVFTSMFMGVLLLYFSPMLLDDFLKICKNIPKVESSLPGVIALMNNGCRAFSVPM